jgi:hypothetical protein
VARICRLATAPAGDLAGDSMPLPQSARWNNALFDSLPALGVPAHFDRLSGAADSALTPALYEGRSFFKSVG